MTTTETHVAWREVTLSVGNDEMVQELRRLSKLNPDNEMCGFIIDADQIMALDNVHPSPRESWSMGVEAQVAFYEKYGQRITAVYHSHPNGRAEPSKRDTEGIQYFYQQGCPWAYLIVTNDGVKQYVLNT